MTSTPTPKDREGSHTGAAESAASHAADGPSAGGFSAATIEALVRYDDASPEELARLEREPGAAAALRELRKADAFLQSGGLLTADPKCSVSSENLFAFGRGELETNEANVVAEHLAQSPEESQWVEALRTSTPPATLTWDAPEAEFEETAAAPVLAGPGFDSATLMVDSDAAEAKTGFTTWLAWTPLAAAALVLAMAIGGSEQRSVLDGGLPNSPIMRSASTDALLFPRGRVIASTDNVQTYASRPLFEVTPVKSASEYGFELRKVADQNAFDEGETIWEIGSKTHQTFAPELNPGNYTWTATAHVQGIDRALGSLSFRVVDAHSVARSLFVRAAAAGSTAAEAAAMPSILREDIRRLHASGFLTDARSKARALPPGAERDQYLAVPAVR